MGKASVIKAEKFWNRIASHYDKEEKKDEKIYHQIIEKLIPYLKPTDRVLDFGAGTGLITNEIAKNVRKVCGIDISSKMVELAMAKAEKRKLNNIQYSHATIFDSSLTKGTFDVILASYTLHLVDEPKMVVQRIIELLKPDGMLISVTACMGEKPIISGFMSIFSRFGFVPKIIPFKLHELEQLFLDGGLEIVKVEKLADTSNQYLMIAKK